MITITLILSQVMVHQYLIQRDLITTVIAKHMISKQQTQMEDYLIKSMDAQIIANIVDGETQI
jgi:hypothetical protein